MDWYGAPERGARAPRGWFQSPDGDSMDWYQRHNWKRALMAGLQYGFQSPDGDSMDWYVQVYNGDTFDFIDAGSFSPLTGIRWIGTREGKGDLFFHMKNFWFQSPDGDSMDWYQHSATAPDGGDTVSVP